MELLDLAKPLNQIKKELKRKGYEGNAYLAADEQLDLLQATIEKIGQLKVFKDHDYMHYVGHGGGALDYRTLKDWLIRSVQEFGTTKTIRDLEKYLTAKEITGYRVMPLPGVHVGRNYRFSIGTKIINSTAREYKHIQRADIPEDLPSVGISWLIYPIKIPIFIVKNDGQKPAGLSKYSRENEIDQKMTDTVLMLNLARPIAHGVQMGRITTTVYKENIPVFGQYYSMTPTNEQGMGPEMLEMELRLANRLLNAFEKKSNKDSLYVPLKRISGFMSGKDLVDKTIDLRLGLESFFLNEDESSELVYRLSTRGAKYYSDKLSRRAIPFKQLMSAFTESEIKSGIGSNSSEIASSRIMMAKLIKKVYGLTSKAVHRGAIKLNAKKKESEKLDMAAIFLQQTLKSVVSSKGELDWNCYDLR